MCMSSLAIGPVNSEQQRLCGAQANQQSRHEQDFLKHAMQIYTSMPDVQFCRSFAHV